MKTIIALLAVIVAMFATGLGLYMHQIHHQEALEIAAKLEMEAVVQANEEAKTKAIHDEVERKNAEQEAQDKRDRQANDDRIAADEMRATMNKIDLAAAQRKLEIAEAERELQEKLEGVTSESEIQSLTDARDKRVHEIQAKTVDQLLGDNAAEFSH